MISIVKDPQVKAIVQRIARSIKPERIILFGSRAEGVGRDDSDIDLAVIYSGPLSKRQVMLQIRNLFQHPDFSMDIVVLPRKILKTRKISPTPSRVS